MMQITQNQINEKEKSAFSARVRNRKIIYFNYMIYKHSCENYFNFNHSISDTPNTHELIRLNVV